MTLKPGRSTHDRATPTIPTRKERIMPDILSTISTRSTPQSRPARADQTRNAAGGYTFQVGDWERLHRFLTLGTDGGTYYTKAEDLTRQNAEVVFRCAAADGQRLVREIVEISTAGRAPKVNSAIFALAVASAADDENTRRAALSALTEVCRTGTHLYTFTRYAEQFRGWGRAMRRAVATWYDDRDLGKLTYQVLKYRQRDGWTHRDLLRLSHADGAGDRGHAALYEWVTKGGEGDGLLPLVEAFQNAQRATTVAEWVRLVEAHKDLSWEMLPDAALTKPQVWEALLHNRIPMTALMRQLGRLSKIGLVSDNLGNTATRLVVEQLADERAIRNARIHPINVLVALSTYASGRGIRSTTGGWQVSQKVVDALDAAFYLAYGNVEASGKRMLLACDVSGSMDSPVSGLPLTCRVVTGALALVTASVEKEHQIVGFTGGDPTGRPSGFPHGGLYRTHGRDAGLWPMQISPRQRLDDVVRYMDGLPFGRTDCGAPMVWALNNKVPVDQFTILTDNETWAGPVHPHQALEQYRQKMGIDSTLVVVAMTATGSSIADPRDPRQLDVSGFDSTVPQVISDFAAGRI